MFKAALHKAISLLIPARCSMCGAHVTQEHTVCGACWGSLEFIADPCCITCGVPMPESASKESECLECINHPPPFAKARAALVYDDASTHLVTRFKYYDQLHLLPLMVRWMEGVGGEMLERADVIVPVPLHWTRLFARKYNQAGLLAQAMASHLNKPYVARMLMRKKRTPPQAKLSKAQRLKNVQGAFQLHPRFAKEDVQGQRVVLVDDVMTTGATIRACAKVLKKAGAKRVDVLTVARTVLGE